MQPTDDNRPAVDEYHTHTLSQYRETGDFYAIQWHESTMVSAIGPLDLAEVSSAIADPLSLADGRTDYAEERPRAKAAELAKTRPEALRTIAEYDPTTPEPDGLKRYTRLDLIAAIRYAALTLAHGSDWHEDRYAILQDARSWFGDDFDRDPDDDDTDDDYDAQALDHDARIH